MKSSYSKLYLFFWRRPLITMILSFIKGLMTGFGLCLFLNGCAPNYHVVQKLHVNMYHLQHVRTGDIHIILSEKDLKTGDTIRLWQLPEIEFDNHYPKYK